MLRLSIASGSPPVAFTAADADVEVWRDGDGVVVAFGCSRGGSHWLRIVGAGVFGFDGTDTVVAYPQPAVSAAVLEDAFRRNVLPLALHARGEEVLHASAVLGASGVVALAAVSETGKSTLAYGLSRRGYPMWADDAVAFEFTADEVLARPLPFAVRLRPESHVYFGGNGSSDVAEPPRPERLSAVVVLERGDAVGIERLDPREAFTFLLSHAYHFTLNDQERRERLIVTYLDLARRVEVYRLRIRLGTEFIPEALDLLERTVRAA